MHAGRHDGGPHSALLVGGFGGTKRGNVMCSRPIPKPPKPPAQGHGAFHPFRSSAVQNGAPRTRHRSCSILRKR
jgi:hypothetical protein